MDQAVGHGAEGHPLHAEAVGGGVAGDIGKDGVADIDGAFFPLQLYHEKHPFRGNDW